MVTIREASKNDIAAITNIFNDAILNTDAIWMDKAVDETERRNWWLSLREKGFPVLVADDDGECVGYASFGSFRHYEGYQHTAELSIYIEKSQQGKGIGKMLLAALIEKAKEKKIHILIAGIEAQNLASLHLHQSFGFIETARMPELGKKRGKWLDLVFMQKTIV